MKPAMFKRLFLTLLIVSCCVSSGASPALGQAPGDYDAQALFNEAGFYDIDPIRYSFRIPGHDAIDLRTSSARLFYSFHRGDDGGSNLPLFVFLNGGPGCATTTNLFAMNTAPYTLDREHNPDHPDKKYARNPYSWTKLGNLLYIDAPEAGFSYNYIANASNWFNRLLEFGPHNFNPFVDAAQVTRMLLRFLEDHETIGDNPVILVGESYGGTRVSTMLNMLLFHSKYGNTGGAVYQDDILTQEIIEHFQRVFPDEPDITPEVVARQFGRQILIEPQLTGPYQDEITGNMYLAENSIIDQIARETTGKDWSRQCGKLSEWLSVTACVTLYYVPKEFYRDPYIYTKPNTWSDDLEAYAMQSLLDVESLSTVLQDNVATIGKIKPEARAGMAYRYPPFISSTEITGTGVVTDAFGIDYSWCYSNTEVCTPGEDLPGEAEQELYNYGLERMNYIESQLDRSASGSLVDTFGRLDPWDEYLVGTNFGVYMSFFLSSLDSTLGPYINADKSPLFGEMFLNNLALVRTFLTDAELDLIIYSPALPESFKRYGSIVRDVEVQRGTDSGSEHKPGYVKISYYPDSLTDVDTTPETRTIFYPYYSTSGHSVSSSQPGEFLQDVEAWLAQVQYFPVIQKNWEFSETQQAAPQ